MNKQYTEQQYEVMNKVRKMQRLAYRIGTAFAYKNISDEHFARHPDALQTFVEQNEADVKELASLLIQLNHLNNDFTIIWTISRQLLAEVLCCALEGGSNYWYRLDQCVEPTVWEFSSEPSPENKGEHWAHDYPFNPGGALLISSALEDSSHKTRCLDAVAIQWGLITMAQKYPSHLSDLFREEFDAETGDVLLQCSLFGELIYG